MKRRTRLIALFLVAITLAVPVYGMTVYDPVNAALNQIRNTLMNTFHLADIKNALDQIFELQRTFEELKRFHDGIDELRAIFSGDYRQLLSRLGLNGITDLGYEISSLQRDFLSMLHGSSSGSFSDYRMQMNAIFGEDPKSTTKPYITQEDLFAADGFRWAAEVRKTIETTMNAGEEISRAASSASPKGAARLSADALGKLLITNAQIQQNQSKLIEIGATQIEQVVREEKDYERERLKFMRELNQLLDALPAR